MWLNDVRAEVDDREEAADRLADYFTSRRVVGLGTSLDGDWGSYDLCRR